MHPCPTRRPPSTAVSATAPRAAPTGRTGGRISPSGPGGRSARTTARTAGAWDDFPHDHARSRAYRWNEDGLAGFCNRFQNLCLALALWNGRDPFLKERLFGLANEEGNHGEDVKEYYFYLDGLPSHAYMRMLYKYPAGRVSLRPAAGRKPPARPVRAGIRPDRRARRRTGGRAVLRHRGRIRQGRPGGHPLPDHGAQPRPRAGRAARPAAGLVSQHLVVGLRERPSGALEGGPVDDPDHAPASGGPLVVSGRSPARPGAPVHRERDESMAAVRGPECRALRQGCVPRGGREWATGTGRIRRARARRRPGITAR